MAPGETRLVTVIVRNEGDASWTAAKHYKFGQKEFLDPVLFGPGRFLINDSQDEIPIYGGIFRGRPKTFQFDVTAPTIPGIYPTHWSMLQELVEWFGEELFIPITVGVPTRISDIHIQNTNVVLTWIATNNVKYSLQFADKLLSPSPVWTNVPGAANLTGPASAPFYLQATNIGGAGRTSRFYRIKVEGQ